MENKSALERTLEERRKKYGCYSDICNTAQSFKYTADNIIHTRIARDYTSYPSYMREGLDMIFHKLARILHGDPAYKDNWTDIIGYSKLVVEEIEKYEKKPNSSIIVSDT